MHTLTTEIYIGLDEAKRMQYILSRGNINNENKASFIKSYICNYYRLKAEDIESQSRRREPTLARQVCMYFLCEKTKLILNEIGAMFGNRTHTTVLYAKQTVLDLIDTNKHFKNEIEGLDILLETELKNLAQTIEN